MTSYQEEDDLKENRKIVEYGLKALEYRSQLEGSENEVSVLVHTRYLRDETRCLIISKTKRLFIHTLHCIIYHQFIE